MSIESTPLYQRLLEVSVLSGQTEVDVVEQWLDKEDVTSEANLSPQVTPGQFTGSGFIKI